MKKGAIFYPDTSLTDVFRKDFGFNESQVQDIALVIGELGNNCVMHSEGKGGAMLYCQKYPSQKYLNIFVVDSGIGIINGMLLNEKYNNFSPKEIFEKAFEFGEGNERGYGQGLYLISQFIKLNNGYLRLITDSYFCHIQDEQMNFDEFNSKYKGVIIHLNIPFKISVTIDEIMETAQNSIK